MATKKWIGTDGSYSTSGNWSPSGVPSAGDTVRLPAGGGDITAGLNQSAVAIDAFIVEEGYSGDIGSDAGYLQLDTDVFIYHGTGVAYVDLGSTTVSPDIVKAADAQDGEHGLYLKGSGIATLSITQGDVGLAALVGETATATTVRVMESGAKCELGPGCTLTTVTNNAGELLLRAAATTLNVVGGTTRTRETGAITTVNQYGGTIYPQSSGTITTHNLYGGTADFSHSGIPRTVTTLNQHARTTSELIYDPAVLTITNHGTPERAVRRTLTTI